MAYTTIPTVADGSPLSHTHLNTLAANGEFLQAITVLPNNGVSSWHRTITGGMGLDNQIYKIQHWHRYLLFQVVSVTGTLDYIRIYLNNALVWENMSPLATTTSFVDLQTMAPSLVVGLWYDLYVHTEYLDGLNELALNYLFENPNSS
jgi:hypothetical protein